MAGLGVELHVPERALCTDNAAMIGVRRAVGDAAARTSATSTRYAQRGARAAERLASSTAARAATCATTRARCSSASATPFDVRSTSRPTTTLRRRYLERIPVVALDGDELYDFFVDEARPAASGSPLE